MKKCIHCGAELAQDAAWCPYCEQSQTEAKPVTFPARHRWRMICGLLGVLILGVVLLTGALFRKPKVYEGGAEVLYSLNGNDCRVLLAFSGNMLLYGKSQAEISFREPAGSNSAIPSQLSVLSDHDPDTAAAFLEQIESCTVTAQPEDGAETVGILGPEPGEKTGFPGDLKADILYSPSTGTNLITWEIKMKNKDILRLHQKITCELLETIEYHYEDTPMNSVEEINALIEKTGEESPDAVLILYLPPVTYEGKLTMNTRTATLIGTEEDGKKTTFTDTLEINTRTPGIAELNQIEFVGDGGTGIIATEALVMQACAFFGWDTGVEVKEGGWANLTNAAFVNNGTGFLCNTKSSTFYNGIFENIVFAENNIGLQIVHTPGERSIELVNPVFDGNKTDYDDPNGILKIKQ